MFTLEILTFFFFIILNVLFINCQFIDQKSNDYRERARFLRGPFFRPSLFHVIKFPNDECTDANNQTGTCYTNTECKLFGGSGTASCARGYGTCCIISRSCHNATSQKVVHFKNPSYPATDDEPNYCDLTIEVKDNDVCQIRLDLLDFQLDAPTNGECLGDKLTVTASGLSTLSIPQLCGSNSNQHLYIHLPQDIRERSTSLLFITNNNGGYRWHIRATQIHCIPDHSESLRQMRSMFPFTPRAEYKSTVPAPHGCLQYFPSQSGTIESFNLGEYLNGLDYAICIERQLNTCKVTFTVSEYDWSISRSDSRFETSATGDTICKGDYLMIPGASQYGEDSTTDRFCGAYLSFLKEGRENFPVVTKTNGPIVLRFHSDYIHDFQLKTGFRLRYEQSDTNCEPIHTTENLLMLNQEMGNRLPNVKPIPSAYPSADTSMKIQMPSFYSRSQIKAKIDEKENILKLEKNSRKNGKILKI